MRREKGKYLTMMFEHTIDMKENHSTTGCCTDSNIDGKKCKTV